MKIAIWGLGRLGSAVAFHLMREMTPEEIQLHDKKDLWGDIQELKQAARGLGLDTKITEHHSICDAEIIAAGVPRLNIAEDVWSANRFILREVLKETRSKHYIILTNPSRRLVVWATRKYPNRTFHHIEEELHEMRGRCNINRILRSKGYTNFAPAVATVQKLRRVIRGYNI